MEAVAVDRAGDEIDGLASKLELVVFVLNPDYQLKIVLNNEESQVVKEAQNITRLAMFKSKITAEVGVLKEHRAL